jgi:ABC-type sugar transport system permease subunit
MEMRIRTLKRGASDSMPRKKQSSLLQRIWKARNAYLFLLPLFVGLAIFSYYPPVLGIFRSLFQWDGIREGTFVGLNNYRRLFQDKIFLDSVPTMFTIMIPRLIIGMVVPFIMAEMIFFIRSRRVQGWYRVIILLPIVAPGVVATLIWKNIYDPNNGLLTAVLRAIGVMEQGQVIDWLGSMNTVIPSIIFMGFPWIGGTSVLIYMSGLMGISTEVIESTRLDGCSTLRRIWSIDIPSLMGQIRYFLVFGIIAGLQDYGVQVVLTQGGPGYSTFVPGYYMYIQAFTAGNMGYACAIGTTIFVVIAVITAFTFKLLNSNRFTADN